MWLNVVTFLNNHKKTLLFVLIGLALLVGAYSFGRYAQPAKVVTQTVTQTRVETRVEYQDRVVTQKVYVQKEKTHEHTETTVEKKPDGTTVTHVTKDKNTDETKNTQTNSTDDKNLSKDAKTETVVTETKIVINSVRPNWRVGLGGGVSIPTLIGHNEMGIPGLKSAVIQVEVGRRLFGPLFLDAFGNSQGTVGLGLSLVL